MTTLTITRPDDWHVHLRDGDVLKDTVKDISRYNGRALIMPNTIPPRERLSDKYNPPHSLGFLTGSVTETCYYSSRHMHSLASASSTPW